MSEAETFKKVLNSYKGKWKSIDVKIACIQINNQWVNLGTKLSLQEVEQTTLEPGSLPNFPCFKMLHETLNIEELESLLSQIEKCSLNINGHDIIFGAVENNQVKAFPSHFSLLRNSSSRHVPFYYPFPYIQLYAAGTALHLLMYNYPGALQQHYFDEKLKAAEHPYDGLEDVFINFFGMSKKPGGNVAQSAFIEVMAPLPMQWGESCALMKGKLTIEVLSTQKETDNDVTIGLIEYSGPSVKNRTSHFLKSTDWIHKENCFIANKDLSLKDVSSVVLLLRFKENAIDHITLRDPYAFNKNPRILAYSHFDEHLSEVRLENT